MPAEQMISRVENEEYLNTIVRAMTTADVRSTTPDSLGRISDYHKIDYSDFLTIANTEHTPLSVLINRKEAARDIQHFWFEQYFPHGTQAAFDGAPWLDSPTAIAETADPTDTSLVAPVQFNNRMMKIGRVLTVSDIARAVFAAGGLQDAFDKDEVGRQFQWQSTMLLREQELAILKSVAGSSPASMRGILGKYSTASGAGTVDGGWYGLTAPDGTETKPVENRTAINLKTGVNPKELIATGTPGADQVLIEKVLNDALYTFYNLYAGPVPTDLFLAPRTINLLQTAARSKVQIFMTQEEFTKRTAMNLGGVTGKYLSDFGEINFTAHPLLHSASTAAGTAGKDSYAESRMLFLYLPGISLIDLVGFGGIHIEPRAKTLGNATDTRVMYEYITLEMRYLLSNGFITGFWHA